MSLIGALNVGKSALAATQAALQTTGNNISNAGDENYVREKVSLSPNDAQKLKTGIYVGTGVNLDSVSREIDDALEMRLRSSTSDNKSADTLQTWLGQAQSVFNELGDDDLSTQASNFFNAWSNLANNPADQGLRQVVITDGQSIAKSINDMHGQFTDLQNDINKQIGDLAGNADNLCSEIASLNTQIATAEAGTGGTANTLRDQRDSDLKSLAQLVDVKTVTEPTGMISVYTGSEPIVSGDLSRGVGTRTDTVDGVQKTVLVVKATNGALQTSSGELGGLETAWKSVSNVLDQMDNYAGGLINELNQVYSSGQGTSGFTSMTSDNQVQDATAALNSTAADLKFPPKTGSFVVHLTNASTGLSTSTLVQVDLDGQNGNDTTLNSLASNIDAIDGVTASVVGGKLQIKSDDGASQITFSQDSSGTLASLGLNTFFTGNDAKSINVNSVVVNNTALLAAAANNDSGDNQTAKAIANLATQPLKSFKGNTLDASYQAIVNDVATKTAAAKTAATAASTVQDTLQAQRDAISGVSIDEEAVNMMQQQRAFQASAKLISTVNDLMQTLMTMI